MHEFELGVFKSFFIHLLRILFAHGGGAISELNTRYKSEHAGDMNLTILLQFPLDPHVRTLHYSPLHPQHVCLEENGSVELPEYIAGAFNGSAMSQPSLIIELQCAIPVVEGLLREPYNSEILDILFTLGEWHTLAKLKLHTDATLNLLALANKGVGRLLRRFKRVTCPNFATKELPSEEASRGRAQARQAAKAKGKARTRPVKTTPKVKEYSLLTYKLHSLGDYVSTIRWFGTSDSYSTQPVRA